MNTTARRLLTLTAVLLLALAAAGCAKKSAPAAVQLIYFYDSPCASCDEEGKFRALLGEQTSDLQPFSAYSLRCVNTFSAGTGELEKLAAEHGLENPTSFGKVLFIGQNVLTGDAVGTSLRQFYWQAAGLGSGKGVVEYYYRPDCPDCQEVSAVLNPYLEGITDRPVVRIDTTDPQTKADFRALLEREKIAEDRYQIPYLIDGGTHYSGTAEITAHVGEAG